MKDNKMTLRNGEAYQGAIENKYNGLHTIMQETNLGATKSPAYFND